MAKSAIEIERKRWTEVLERLPVHKRKELLYEAERYTKEVERRIRKLLRPRTRKSSEGFVCWDSKTHLFGVGQTKEEAHEDYKAVLKEMYESLKEDEHILHPRLLPQLELLRSVFEDGGQE